MNLTHHICKLQAVLGVERLSRERQAQGAFAIFFYEVKGLGHCGSWPWREQDVVLRWGNGKRLLFRIDNANDSKHGFSGCIQRQRSEQDGAGKHYQSPSLGVQVHSSNRGRPKTLAYSSQSIQGKQGMGDLGSHNSKKWPGSAFCQGSIRIWDLGTYEAQGSCWEHPMLMEVERSELGVFTFRL